MWQPQAVLPSEHEFGKQEGSVTQHVDKGHAISSCKGVNTPAMTKNGLSPKVRFQAS